MAEIDAWRAAQNWIAFSGLAGAIGLYYWLSQKQSSTTRPAALSTAKTPVTNEKQSSVKQAAVKKAPKSTKLSDKKAADLQTSISKLPQSDHVAEQTSSKTKDGITDDDFAKGMMRARQGINVKSADKGKDRVRTVKPKGSIPVLSGDSLQVNGDDGEWSPVSSPLPKVTGVEDMLETPAPPPSVLRITAPLVPVKDKPARQPKKEVVETKKQRQSRKKNEQQRLLREESEQQRKVMEEKQRRTAREARGEPAKNGVASSVPAQNAWSSSRSANVVANSETRNMPLLDTLEDGESNSSSNEAQPSTAATSPLNGVPTQSVDAPSYEHLVEPLDVAWEEVPTKQKKRVSKAEVNGSLIPAGAALIANGSNPGKAKSTSRAKANGFSALNSEDEA